eukprot:scaffold6781_cov204-Amphora_coffeaeformis.AAC.26
MVDSWSTREQRLAEQQTERERNEGVIDVTGWTKEEQTERMRLAQLVQDWTHRGWIGDMMTMVLDNSSQTGVEEEYNSYPTFDVPLDYRPKCLDEAPASSSSSKGPVFRQLTVDGPHLTFDAATSSDQAPIYSTTQSWDTYEKERARLASLVGEWAGEDDETTQRNEDDDDEEYDFYSPDERQERARLARKVDAWVNGGGLHHYLLGDGALTAATFDNDLSEEEGEAAEADKLPVVTMMMTPKDLEERIRLAKMVDEWTIGVGPYQVKSKGPVISFDDVLQEDEFLLSPEERAERLRLAKLVEDWTADDDDDDGTSKMMGVWERFQKMLRAEEDAANHQTKQQPKGSGGCFCFRIMPHRKAALS